MLSKHATVGLSRSKVIFPESRERIEFPSLFIDRHDAVQVEVRREVPYFG